MAFADLMLKFFNPDFLNTGLSIFFTLAPIIGAELIITSILTKIFDNLTDNFIFKKILVYLANIIAGIIMIIIAPMLEFINEMQKVTVIFSGMSYGGLIISILLVTGALNHFPLIGEQAQIILSMKLWIFKLAYVWLFIDILNFILSIPIVGDMIKLIPIIGWIVGPLLKIIKVLFVVIPASGSYNNLLETLRFT